MSDERDKQYVENIGIIDSLLEKQRRKWMLKAVAWMDYDDVKQIIRLHLYNKWHLYDQTKPIEPWANRVISNQIRNLLRNNYTNFARPCLNCPHNAGGDDCNITKSGAQDSSCSLFKKWAERKRDGYNTKLPLPLENHIHELEPNGKLHHDLESMADKVRIQIKTRVSARYYRAYVMMCVESKTDDEIAKFMGYKSTEKNRKAGYKQIKNLKEIFRNHVKEIIDSEDIAI